MTNLFKKFQDSFYSYTLDSRRTDCKNLGMHFGVITFPLVYLPFTFVT